MQKLTGKKMILKNLHNMATQLKPGHKNDFEELLAEMQKIPGLFCSRMMQY